MRIDNAGLTALIKHEGKRTQVYDDRTGKTISSYSQLVGYPTIGVGHLITTKQRASFASFLKGRKKLTDFQVTEILRKDVKRFEDSLNKKIRAPMTQSMWNALVSMAFNTGANSYAVKNAISAINQENYQAAAKAILNGPIKSKGKILSGLVKRRKQEASLFMKDGKPGGIGKVILPALGIGAVGALTFFFIRNFGAKNE